MLKIEAIDHLDWSTSLSVATRFASVYNKFQNGARAQHITQVPFMMDGRSMTKQLLTFQHFGSLKYLYAAKVILCRQIVIVDNLLTMTLCYKAIDANIPK